MKVQGLDETSAGLKVIDVIRVNSNIQKKQQIITQNFTIQNKVINKKVLETVKYTLVDCYSEFGLKTDKIDLKFSFLKLSLH